MSRRTITAGDLNEGDYVYEDRRDNEDPALGWTPVPFRVDAIEVGRFVHFTLEDGSDRVLSPYVEVDIEVTE